MYPGEAENMGCGSSSATQVKKKMYREYQSEQSTCISIISNRRGDPDGDDDILGETIQESNNQKDPNNVHQIEAQKKVHPDEKSHNTKIAVKST